MFSFELIANTQCSLHIVQIDEETGCDIDADDAADGLLKTDEDMLSQYRQSLFCINGLQIENNTKQKKTKNMSMTFLT